VRQLVATHRTPCGHGGDGAEARGTVWVSDDLIARTKLPGDVIAAGTQASFTDTTIPPGLPTRFYYDQEEP
jgi:hypothetical protein